MEIGIEKFSERLVENIYENFAGDDYKVEAYDVTKNNNTIRKCIVISEFNEKISPTIYIDGLYQDFLEGETLDKVAERVWNTYCAAPKAPNIEMDADCFLDFEAMKKMLNIRLVNTESNKEALENRPHINLGELSIVCVLNFNDRASASVLNSHMDTWGTNTIELMETAFSNFSANPSTDIKGITYYIRKMMGDAMFDSMYPDVENEELFVLTNGERSYGATEILRKDVLKDLSERLGDNLIILPSAVHEVLVLRQSTAENIDFYKALVHDVNSNEVPLEDILSDEVFMYQRDIDSIMCLTKDTSIISITELNNRYGQLSKDTSLSAKEQAKMDAANQHTKGFGMNNSLGME